MRNPQIAIFIVFTGLAELAAAAQQPTFQPLSVANTPAAKAEQKAARARSLLPAPKLSESRAAVLPDGTRHIVCDDIPNPRYEESLRKLQAEEQP
jgi:hypothetical protein